MRIAINKSIAAITTYLFVVAIGDTEDKRSPISPASKPQQVENQVPVTNSSTIPAQSGSCKELRARGITNIDVSANPWASKLDRDKDGVACESK